MRAPLCYAPVAAWNPDFMKMIAPFVFFGMMTSLAWAAAPVVSPTPTDAASSEDSDVILRILRQENGSWSCGSEGKCCDSSGVCLSDACCHDNFSSCCIM